MVSRSGTMGEADAASTGEGVHTEGLGVLIRERRQHLGLTLRQVSELADCAISYLSAIENGQRAGPPSDAVLGRIESALGMRGGELLGAARWQETPAEVRREMERLRSQQRVAAELITKLKAAGPRALDELHKSGELARTIEKISPGAAESAGIRGYEREELPREIPLINSVTAGYPKEFTDLGYPARIADQYVRCPDVNDPDAFAARVVGGSMMPEYREGDVVVFSPMKTVASGMDCFVRLEPDHESTFKRVYIDGEAGAELIRLQPLNPAFAAKVVPRERVAGLYAAVSVIRKVG